MDDLVSRNKVLEAVRSGTTHDDIRARIEIMEPVPAIPISVIEQIKAEIEKNSYLIVHGVNNHEQGMTVYGIMQVIDHHIKEVHGMKNQYEIDYQQGYDAANDKWLEAIKKLKDGLDEYKSRQLSDAIGIEDLETGKQVALEYVSTLIDDMLKECTE